MKLKLPIKRVGRQWIDANGEVFASVFDGALLNLTGNYPVSPADSDIMYRRMDALVAAANRNTRPTPTDAITFNSAAELAAIMRELFTSRGYVVLDVEEEAAAIFAAQKEAKGED